MNDKEKSQVDSIAEKFGKMDESQKALLCAYGDGLLAAQEIMEQKAAS